MGMYKDNPLILDGKVLLEAKELLQDRFIVVVDYFLQDAKTYMDEIEASVEKHEMHEAIRPSHSLKSSSQQFGAFKLAQAAREAEHFAREYVDGKRNSIVAVLPIMERVRSAFIEAETALKKMC
jgi:HPt (histidine-containing phosphotransfer) domain-containing protein